MSNRNSPQSRHRWAFGARAAALLGAIWLAAPLGAQEVAEPYLGGKAPDAQLASLAEAEITKAGGDAALAAQTWIDLAWRAIGAGDGEKAVSHLNTAWAIRAGEPGIPYAMMVATHLRGDADVAVHYEKALKVMPKEAVKHAHMDYARILAERGQLDDAIVALRREADLPNGDIGALEFLARLCRLNEDKKCQSEAITLYQKRLAEETK